MPPLRLILILIGCVGIPILLTFSTLLHAHPRSHAEAEPSPEISKSSFRTFFSFHSPSTLFTPSAIISLTDDNSTFFLARPSDFGPTLDGDGMSGELWIGSGFGDGGHGGSDISIEGELGCSDIPGWDDASQQFRRDLTAVDADQNSQNKEVKKRTVDETKTTATMSGAARREYLDATEPNDEDGTDDHLHHPLPSSPVSKPAKLGQPAEQEQNLHGDIQSLQESAEISGKVAVLSRGGCGFLEKVKWAQRRGAIALIVGDNTRGGGLVTMYARGDTSNVSIPSVFTSHTTAHLLASLIPAESTSKDPDGTKSEGSRQGNTHKDAKVLHDKPASAPGTGRKSTPLPSQAKSKSSKFLQEEEIKGNWFKSLFGLGHSAKLSSLPKDSTRPPSSGRLDWFTPKWPDKASKDGGGSKSSPKNGKSNKKSSGKEGNRPGSHPGSKDDFEIGIQDWRDPDLVAAKSSSLLSSSTSKVAIPQSTASLLGKSGKEKEQDKGVVQMLSGGSITPGSGQYHKPDPKAEKQDKEVEVSTGKDGRKHDNAAVYQAKASGGKSRSNRYQEQNPDEHEGLWVTITPTTMSTSPFFDTLLVLVVSPLVTLTVVYALLLLRSRIRRRRWRAPKSVVDRLPIRTYQTMSCSSTSSSTRLTSPLNSSPATPPHETAAHAGGQRRPRSATASGIGEAVSASLERVGHKSPMQDKGRGNKKYSGKQLECVVCLEEYVEGKSKVMSLPCGHEFHAECM